MRAERLVFRRTPHARLSRLPADWLIPVPASLAQGTSHHVVQLGACFGPVASA